MQSPPKSRDLGGVCIMPYAGGRLWDLDWALPRSAGVFWSARVTIDIPQRVNLPLSLQSCPVGSFHKEQC